MTLILGRKQGMTQIFAADGTHVGVTVVAAGPCVVTHVRTQSKEGYDAVQLGFEDVADKRVRLPQRKAFEKIGIAPKRFLREERLWDKPAQVAVGETITVGAFAAGDLVDVIGTTKGRGFAGTIKRHKFHRGPETHGCMNVRQPGSIGTKRTGKLFPGKRMSGHFGTARQTTKNLEVVRIDAGRNLLYLKGSVPGPNGGFVQVQTAKTGVKKKVAPPVKAKAKAKK